MSNDAIVQHYFHNVDPTYLPQHQSVSYQNVCMECHRGELVLVEEEGIVVCSYCAVFSPYLVENEKPSYKDPPKEMCYYAYRRINHFKEIVSQFQGKPTSQITEQVLARVRKQLHKERIAYTSLTFPLMKATLKKLGFNKYYEHIPYINKRFGREPCTFSPQLEDTLCNLFVEIQAPYAKHCPDDRINFLHYYYTLFKLCELLGERQYLDAIYEHMLLDRFKIIPQDNIWKLICTDLRWPFVRTV